MCADRSVGCASANAGGSACADTHADNGVLVMLWLLGLADRRLHGNAGDGGSNIFLAVVPVSADRSI